ncbi:MAG: hypothetical protein HY929_08280 [Euryarchaeota archaeon]|nr:hypothetical protein [Euryarchaeota archaeon]
MATVELKAKVLEKVLDIAQKELDPMEYVYFLDIIAPKVGDLAKDLRKTRDAETREDFLKWARKKSIAVK